MNQQIREFASRIKPPGKNASPAVVNAWRWFVAVTVSANALALCAHIMLACGYATALGYAGFAKADELQTYIKGESSKRVRSLTREMLDAKQKQCLASGEAKRLYLDSYNDLRAEYFDLTRREFPDPPCRDFQ